MVTFAVLRGGYDGAEIGGGRGDIAGGLLFVPFLRADVVNANLLHVALAFFLLCSS